MAQSAVRTLSRLDMRVDEEIKLLAERATAVGGYASVTEFMTSLIRENAPKILELGDSMTLANERYDQFLKVCMDTTAKPSNRLFEAAAKLDKEGL
jgi:uncharacterized protein (DUF1778 family)